MMVQNVSRVHNDVLKQLFMSSQKQNNHTEIKGNFKRHLLLHWENILVELKATNRYSSGKLYEPTYKKALM